jgi:hypothetical protein
MIVVLIIAICQQIYWFYVRRTFKSCTKAIVTGFVTDANYHHIKSIGLWVDYQFEINGKIFEERKNIGGDYYPRLAAELINKQFPVAYCKSDPSISKILIAADAYEEAKLQRGDSVLWVEEYRKK